MLQEINQHKQWVDQWAKIKSRIDDAQTLIELAEESKDESYQKDISAEISVIGQSLADLEFKNMLSGVDDHRNAILNIHSGAGGTESQDWADMLLRMYTRWCENKKYKVALVERLDGDGAGIKSATLEVVGDHAFGYLKAEIGYTGSCGSLRSTQTNGVIRRLRRSSSIRKSTTTLKLRSIPPM